MVKKPFDIYWEGQSGKKYGYLIVSVYASFKDVPGNYIFAKETKTGWKPLCIDQTNNLAFRLPYNDRKRVCTLQNEATHIHTHFCYSGSEERIAEALDLTNKWNPVCNA